MPVTGKSALAHYLANLTNSKYLKSVISDTSYGKLMKTHSTIAPKQIEMFFQVDLLLDELRIQKLYNNNNIIRDKSWLSTIAHLKTHGFENNNPLIQNIIKCGYELLAEYAILPDLFVYMKPDFEKVKQMMSHKDDLSTIDKYLIENFDLYKKQNDELWSEINKLPCKILVMESFTDTIENMSKIIMENV